MSEKAVFERRIMSFPPGDTVTLDDFLGPISNALDTNGFELVKEQKGALAKTWIYSKGECRVTHYVDFMQGQMNTTVDSCSTDVIKALGKVYENIQNYDPKRV